MVQNIWLAARRARNATPAVTSVDPLRILNPIDRLVMSEQHLLMLSDIPGQLTQARSTLPYYPHDMWLYLLAAQWAPIAHYAFVGRTGEVDDELGSRPICARLRNPCLSTRCSREPSPHSLRVKERLPPVEQDSGDPRRAHAWR